jgi:hypothetical protein
VGGGLPEVENVAVAGDRHPGGVGAVPQEQVEVARGAGQDAVGGVQGAGDRAAGGLDGDRPGGVGVSGPDAQRERRVGGRAADRPGEEAGEQFVDAVRGERGRVVGRAARGGLGVGAVDRGLVRLAPRPERQV